MKTALQVTNFNFYGDELIALRDNSTGKIYTSINSVLKGIGFTDKDQIRKRRDKWINDVVISKGICVFNIPTYDGVAKNDTPINNQETYCISQHKLPIALAKINITPKMKQLQPELASKLELYQDKCADVLASVFIDKKSPSDISTELLAETISNAIILALQPVYEKLSNIEEQSNKKKLPEKKYSRWKTNTFNKLNTLHSYANEHSDENLKLSETIHLVIEETEDTYAIEINDYVDAYKSEFDLDTNPYVLDVINRYKDVRDMFSLTLDSVMEKLHLIDKSDKSKTRNIFDELASKLEK